MQRDGMIREYEYQVRTRNGSVLWLSDSASAVRNDAVSANLFIEGRRKLTRVTDVSDPTDKVVQGVKRVTVRIR